MSGLEAVEPIGWMSAWWQLPIRTCIRWSSEINFGAICFYRLNVFPVRLPPLRDRREDIVPLMMHFVDISSRRMGKTIEHVPPETISAFLSYSWPGNIRELQNLVERAVILSQDGVFCNPLSNVETQEPTRCLSFQNLRDSERALLLQALESVGWVVGGAKGAAVKLGVKRTTLVSKMKRLGISKSVRFGIEQ